VADTPVNQVFDHLIQTRQEAEMFVSQLDEVIEGLYDTTVAFPALLQTHLPRGKQEALAHYIKEQAGEGTERRIIKHALETLKQDLLQKPILRLTLAFEPTQQTILALRTWFHKELFVIPLLDITVDSTLIGGCILTAGGFVKEYSVKKAFEEKKQRLLDAFTAYA
jgi:hypothetical protein